MDTKLKLNKEVIAQLNDDSMNRVQGGVECKPHTDTCTCGGPVCTNTNECTGQYCYTKLDTHCVCGLDHKIDDFMS